MEEMIESRVATPLFILVLIVALAGLGSIGRWASTASAHATGAMVAEVHSTSRDRDFVARRNHLLKPGTELLAER